MNSNQEISAKADAVRERVIALRVALSGLATAARDAGCVELATCANEAVNCSELLRFASEIDRLAT